MEDLYRKSQYSKVHRNRLRCPFCGNGMTFPATIFYDCTSEFWLCNECGLQVGNLRSFPAELVSRIRQNYLAALKKIRAEKMKQAEDVQLKISKWGKFMSSREKVKLLAEKLKIEESDVES